MSNNQQKVFQSINQSIAEVPESFRAVRVHEYGKLAQVDNIPTLELQKGEFIIKVEAAPINPFFIKGLYAQLPLPVIPDWQGTIVVVKLGDGTPEWLKLGDRVAINARFGKGTFAEYAVDDETTFEQAAFFYINPLTFIGIIDVVQRSGQNVLVQNAAASALGRQLSRYAQFLNIKQEQVELLKSKGVLNQSDPNFGEQLRNLSEQLKHKYCLTLSEEIKQANYLHYYLMVQQLICSEFFLDIKKCPLVQRTFTIFHQVQPFMEFLHSNNQMKSQN